MKLEPIKDLTKIRDISGSRYGRLFVVKPAGVARYKTGMAVYFLCKCDCGEERIIQRSNLERGNISKCKCEKVGEPTIYRGAWVSPLYKRWRHMISRCEDPKSKSFNDYGARGITVCERWRVGDGQSTGFELFEADMGFPPNGFDMIDRIDNSRGYSPDNCRWASRQQQNSNKRSNKLVCIDGQTKTVAQWAKIYNIDPFTVYARIRNGWDSIEAVTTPVRRFG